MMKLLQFLFICLFSLISVQSFGQTFGNEWINYGQRYFKIPVTKTGFQKISYSELDAAGVPLASVLASNLQVFGRENEVPLYVHDGGNDQINVGNYIAFYAEKNDGWLDKTLYKDSTHMANPFYSLYSDTIFYFLTWNITSNNLRFSYETASDF